MVSKLVEVGATLGVGDDDLKDVEKQRRRDTLTRIAQVLSIIAAPILGILAAEVAYPARNTSLWDSYPFIPLMLVSSTRSYSERRPWKGPIVLSVALFVVAFLLVATFNSAHNDNFGISPKYGVFSTSVETRR